MLHGLAFIVWDIGSRSPGRLLTDIHDSFGSARALTKGVWRFLLGMLLLLGGALLMLSVTIADIRTEFAILETGAILAGLLIEMLIGEPIRMHLSSR